LGRKIKNDDGLFRRRKHKSSILPAGKIEIGLKYDQERFKLLVSVIAAK
jgi:hypothetical protein